MRRIAYVCEGGGDIGWGHVGRGRSLAETDADVSLVIGRGYGEVRRWMKDAGAKFSVAQWESALQPLALPARNWNAAIVDAYDVSNRWIEEASASVPVAIVDDWQREDFSCRVLVNANVGASAADYRSASFQTGLFGERYAFVRAEIVSLRGATSRSWQARPRVLVSLGGSDPHDAVTSVMGGLASSGLLRSCNFEIVVGASYSGKVASFLGVGEQVLSILRQPSDFSERLARADIVICGGSVTSYEAACLGRPFIPLAIVGNQRRITRAWAGLGWGQDSAVGEAGWMERLLGCLDGYLASPLSTQARASELQSLVDGLGSTRVREAIL